MLAEGTQLNAAAPWFALGVAVVFFAFAVIAWRSNVPEVDDMGEGFINILLSVVCAGVGCVALALAVRWWGA